jgi:hypothetical protein
MEAVGVTRHSTPELVHVAQVAAKIGESAGEVELVLTVNVRPYEAAMFNISFLLAGRLEVPAFRRFGGWGGLLRKAAGLRFCAVWGFGPPLAAPPVPI